MISTAEVGRFEPTHPQLQLNRLVILLLGCLTMQGSLGMSLGMVSKSINQYMQLKAELHTFWMGKNSVQL